MSTTTKGPWGRNVADAVPSQRGAGDQMGEPGLPAADRAERLVRGQEPGRLRGPDPLRRVIHSTAEGVQALQSLLEPLDPDQDRIARIEALLEALGTGQLRLEAKLDALTKGLASAGYVRSASPGPGRTPASGSTS